MSSRQLRKLQQQRVLEEAKVRAETEVSEASEDEQALSQPLKPKVSLFASLAALDVEGEEDNDEENEEVANPPENLSDQEEPVPTSTPKKAKKSKKKKKKGKNGKVETKLEQTTEKDNGVDEIDVALQELNIKNSLGEPAGEATKLTPDPQYERVCALLGVNTQHLKVANEMRNLFGRTAVDNHDDAGGPVGRGARRRQRGQNQQIDLETALKGRHAPGKGLSELTLRRNYLIQGKDDWPRATTGGLTMAIVDDQQHVDGTVEFRYVHDQAYQSVQGEFHAYVEMGEPQNLIGLLTRNPYHISLLIQVSKIAKDQSDHSLSADLLERALFTFGRAASSLFNTKLAEGKARLDFARPENRELWLAGYQYIKSLVMKGTYRTAFEWAKLLLSLDPEQDPYCMRLMIHHLSLRAHELEWLLDVAESKITKIWAAQEEVQTYAEFHTTPSLAFAALQLRDGVKCRELLRESMEKVPWLFCRLFKELNLDAPPSIWGIEPRTDAESLFTGIYVLQTKDLWNTPEATSVLMEIAHSLPKVDVAQIPKVSNSEMTLDVVRFVYLDNTPSLMALTPSILLHRSNNSDSDPLPPDINVLSYGTQRVALPGVRDDFFNPIAAIARLIAPGMRRDVESDEAGDEDEDGGGLPEDYDERLREVLEEVVAADGAPVDEAMPSQQAAGEDGQMTASIARRLLSLFWPAAATPASLDSSEFEDPEDYESEDDSDEMPDLI